MIYTSFNLITDLDAYTATTRNFLDQIALMDINDKRGIFDALITARNNLDFHLYKYYNHAYVCFKETSVECNSAAYNMMTNPRLKEADQMRDTIIDIFKTDQYKITKEMNLQDPVYYNTKFNSSSHPDHATRTEFTLQYARCRVLCNKGQFNLSIKTDRQVLDQWAQAKTNFKK